MIKLLFIRLDSMGVNFTSKKGMEMVQVAILVAIAVGLGMLFRERISDFISSTFDSLSNANF